MRTGGAIGCSPDGNSLLDGNPSPDCEENSSSPEERSRSRRPSPSLLPVPLSFLILLAALPIVSDATPHRHWSHHAPGFCSGDANGRTLPGISTSRLDALRSIYQNCTRVYGNVEITHITNVTDDDLDFLDDIEEIKGYILIYKADVRRIRFRSLRIIWGDDLFEVDSALHISASERLEELLMSKLRSIHKGIMHVDSSPNLCYLKNNVNLLEIVDLDKNRTNLRMPRRSCPEDQFKCHPSCGGACWGPTEEDCQSLYRTACPDYCTSRMCYNDGADGRVKCCDAQCVAGCSGPTARDCFACSGRVEEGRCTPQCTNRRKLDYKTGMMVLHEDGFYTHDRYCVKKCPENLLIMEDSFCVKKCSEGYYEEEDGSKRCVKCDGDCPNVCYFTEALTALTIKQLQNCTKIDGFIRLLPNAFHEHYDPEMKKHVPPLRISDLDVLRTVRVVTYYIYIALENGAPLTNLDFLEHLQVIEGRSLYNTKQALIVSSNDNLEHLGLRSLRRISKGDIIVTSNYDLCFAETINWRAIVDANATSVVRDNKRPERCREQGNVCDQKCDPTHGCWGRGPRQCARCRDWKQRGECVRKCDREGFYANETARECAPCFATCLTCTGPSEMECTSCRNVTLFHAEAAVPGEELLLVNRDSSSSHKTPINEQVDRDDEALHLASNATELAKPQRRNVTCFWSCPEGFYEEARACKPCHIACAGGCVGPSDVPGARGCNRCHHAQVAPHDNNGTLRPIRCLHVRERADKLAVCTASGLADHYYQVATVPLVDDLMCLRCESECASCTSYGNSPSRNGCECRSFRLLREYKIRADEREKCVEACPRNSYMIENRTESQVGICGTCSLHCNSANLKETDPVCTGPTDVDCTHCVHVAVPRPDGRQRCTDSCPEGTFLYKSDKRCYDTDYEKRDAVRRTVIACAIIAIVLIAAVVIFCAFRFCRRYQMELEREKAAHGPELVEAIPIDGFTRPNMERLTLIPRQRLDRSRKLLGSGAFGEVYAGVWIPVSSGKKVRLPVAIKVVKDPSGKAQAEMLDEATKMAMMRHEHLLRIVGVCLSGSDLQLITLLRPLGNLLGFLQKHKQNLGGRELLLYAYQIASGMKYLSEHRLVHRDLAARNVLVKNPKHVEITDFGLAKMIDYGSENVLVGEGKVAPKWLAIEALENHIYNTATDVWAYGVTVWEILTCGESPYAGMSPMDIRDFLLNGERLHQPANCSPELYQMLLQCWLEKPDSRPTFAVLRDQAQRFCRAPHIFIVDGPAHSLDGMLEQDQRELIEQLIEDKNFEDPQDYQFRDTVPPTPTDSAGGAMSRTSVGRLDSNNSNSLRYQFDPRQQFMGMDDGNYLVPNSKGAVVVGTALSGASGGGASGDGGSVATVDPAAVIGVYTPVVNEHGETSLISAHDYYNDVEGASGYLNEPLAKKRAWRKKRDQSKKGVILEEETSCDAFLEKESAL